MTLDKASQPSSDDATTDSIVIGQQQSVSMDIELGELLKHPFALRILLPPSGYV